MNKTLTKKETKDINSWTRKDFDALPGRDWDEDIGEFDSLVILPTKRIHDSGFRCMDFVAVRKGVPLIRLSGCSDVIHIDGGHSTEVAENDIIHAFRLSKKGTILIMDDYDFLDLHELWDKYVHIYDLKPLDVYTYSSPHHDIKYSLR